MLLMGNESKGISHTWNPWLLKKFEFQVKGVLNH